MSVRGYERTSSGKVRGVRFLLVSGSYNSESPGAGRQMVGLIRPSARLEIEVIAVLP